ncbi:MAG: TauD/TfdA family dioxygenase [Pseudomonadota bacterium]
MKNLKISSANNVEFSYQAPASWGKGDIYPSHLHARAKTLIEYILAHNPSTVEIINLRSSDQFKQFYIDFHKELEEGTGVVFLKNFISCTNFDASKIHEIFMNFCLFIGEPVPINKLGEVLREVKDIGLKDSVAKPVRGHLTNQSLAFHSDRADITTLLCMSPAYQGGEFKVGSSARLFHELKKRKDFLDILSSNIPHDLRDEGSDDANICAHPIVSYENIFCVRYIRKFIESTARFGLTMDPKLVAALDYIDTIVNSESFSHEFYLNPGDFIMINNHLTLHSRNSFIDSESQKRCLLRIWLSTEFSRPLPESFKPIFYQVTAGSSRGGIR